MQVIRDYGALSAAISRQFRPGVAANRTLGADELRCEIARGTLLAHEWAGGLLLLRRRPTHHILHFYLTDLSAAPDAALPPDTMVELPLHPRRLDKTEAFFAALGFRPVLRRVRLARPALGEAETPAPDTQTDPAPLLALLRAQFDARTGCLPLLDELAADLRAGHVLTDGPDALLRFSLDRTAEIRQLAVAPARRGQGAARALVARFNRCTADRRALVWTGTDNAAALHVYQKEGFAPDGWKSLVMTNQPNQNE